MEFVTGKEALLILNITTRQGLHKIVTNNKITVKSKGPGKPNLYLKDDLEKYLSENKKNIEKHKNPKVTEKVKAKKKEIELAKNNIKDLKENKAKNSGYEEKNLDLTHPDFSPLNEIGQSEYLRVEQLLKEMGTYDEVDRSLLLFYSISYQKYINAVTMSAQQDDTTTDDFGNLKIHPYFQVADKCFNHMVKLAEKMGIGARSRIGLASKKDDSKKGIFDILAEDNKFS
ncbi:P27 family phage terminase small subunit [Aliarcobacter lanthieri]|uniref:P27 family phage terminase small subunit n=1 Tax=Aliarcobacter lanthieri TaxID=1355374 RepID=UPI003AAB3634